MHPGINRHFDITKAVHAAEVATTKPKNADRKAYLVGGGIGSLAAAAFMIRDGGVPGRNITIYEAMPGLGGSLDGGGNAADGYRLRGGRMLTTDNYECTWGLFKSIASLSSAGSAGNATRCAR